MPSIESPIKHDALSSLKRNLGMIETVGLSTSIVAPTMAMSFTTVLTAQAAGRSVPLVFLLGTVMIAIVGLSFITLGKRFAHLGSIDTYVRSVFGVRAGFVTAWVLFFTYLMFTAVSVAMIGNFLSAAFAHFAIELPQMWLIATCLCALAITWLAWYDIRIATSWMLILEGGSILIILALAIVIFRGVGLSAIPFQVDRGYGWSGIGYGMAFSTLAFAGFEGAAAIGRETRQAQRTIPAAILLAVCIAGVFYLIVSYAEVMGYGLNNIKALANADAPLDALATKYFSSKWAIAIDIAACLSAFAAALGCLSATSRMLYSVGQYSEVAQSGMIEAICKTPRRAVLLGGGTSIAGLCVWGARYGASVYGGSVFGIGTLSLIVVYLAASLAAMVQSFRKREFFMGAVSLLGGLMLFWPLWNNLFPIPKWPGNIWPYIVMAWIVIGSYLSLFTATASSDT